MPQLSAEKRKNVYYSYYSCTGATLLRESVSEPDDDDNGNEQKDYQNDDDDPLSGQWNGPIAIVDIDAGHEQRFAEHLVMNMDIGTDHGRGKHGEMGKRRDVFAWTRIGRPQNRGKQHRLSARL